MMIHRTRALWTTLIFALIACPLMTCLSTPTHAQGTAKLDGLIYDEMGKPYPGVVLTLTNSKTKETFMATSDGNGHYSLRGMPPGMYSISLKMNDKSLYQGSLTLAEGPSFTNLNLKEILTTDKGALAEIAKRHKAEEETYKALNAAHTGAPANQIRLGEDFLSKYPDSHYLPQVYSQLMNAYLATNQQDKMVAAGQKAIELNPDDVNALTMMAMTLSRTPGSTQADTMQRYKQAEDYAKHAIEVVPDLPKPVGMSDDAFDKTKNNALSTAHSSLGIVDFQHKQYPDAIKELSQAVQLASNPDPVDYFILGTADTATSHFNEAAAAFDKCAAVGPLASRCKSGEDAAKKSASTQLSAPSN